MRKINGIINICHGRPEKLAERVERFIKENKYKIKLDYGKFPDRPYDSKAVWGDDKKIKYIKGLFAGVTNWLIPFIFSTKKGAEYAQQRIYK